MVQTAYTWKPIQDMPENWAELASTELENLASIWKSKARKLQESDALKQFNERLSREWAVETGIIEGLYSIDRGVTQVLIEKGIEAAFMPHGSTDKPAEQIIPILKDQQEALEGLFSFVAQKRELSIFYIKELHQVFTRHQEMVDAVDAVGRRVEVRLLHGQWKQSPNNPTRIDGKIHEYCPPLQVQSEMERLLNLHLEHSQKGVSPEIEAAWLHHRFTQIHPFQDGNGRVARTLASLVFLRKGLFPIVIRTHDRQEYIAALEAADMGNLSALIDLFSRLQERIVIKAVGLST